MGLGSLVSYSKNFKDANVGDFIYANGEVYSTKGVHGSKCIGVVISMKPTKEQIEMGFTHGTFVSLEDISGLYNLNFVKDTVMSVELPRYSYLTPLTTLLEDRSGYKYTYNSPLYYSEAAQACERHVIPGQFHSKCFIPTPGQWYEMLMNVGQAKINSEGKIENPELVRNRINHIIGGFWEDDRNVPSEERNKYWLTGTKSFNCGWCGRLDYVGCNNFYVNRNEAYRYGVNCGEQKLII